MRSRVSWRGSSMSDQRRLFFGLRPSATRRGELEHSVNDWQLGGRPVAAGNYHITLVFLGSCDAPSMERAKQAAGAVHARPLTLVLSRVEYWHRPRIAALVPRVVPPALERLQRELALALRTADFELEDRVYRPHLTLARKAVQREPFDVAPQRFRFARFGLFESRSGLGGVRYIELDTWSLTGAPGGVSDMADME